MTPLNGSRTFRLCAFCASFFLVQAANTVRAEEAFHQCGKASWYSLGGMTASGERANPKGLTAAHRTLPFGTMVTVTNLSNGKSVTVRINDRGPFAKGRVIDVTRAAARKLGFLRMGVTKVHVTDAGTEKAASPQQKCQ